MRKGGGKAKGGEYERTVCKKLSLWISNNRQEDVFWRSAMSGGRATVASKSGVELMAQLGDISAISPLGYQMIKSFFIECKFYKKLDYDNIIKETGKFLEFWDEASEEASKRKKIPILIAKQNFFPETLCTNSLGLRKLRIRIELVKIHIVQKNMFVLLFDDFLENVKPKPVRRKERRIRL